MSVKNITNGDTFLTNEGCACVVIDYINSSRIIIKFLDDFGHEKSVAAKELRLGMVKNPFHPSVLGVGFIGVGEYNPSHKGKMTRPYRAWFEMLRRCYDSSFKKTIPTYDGCTVHPDWLNFQNFAKWFSLQNKPEEWELDKDILKKGNKVYSPEFCRLVPSKINTLFTKSNAKRGSLPIGVSLKGDRYQAIVFLQNGRKTTKTFSSPLAAFLAYKESKEMHIKEQAEIYKTSLDCDVYEAMMSYVVSPSD